MAETLNAYAEWLGVQSTAAQPNHYELLRLQPFESNQDTIQTAANMQMAKVRGVRPGAHLDVWSRLLDELGAAKRCLTDLIEKSQYDQALRESGWSGSPTSSNASPPGSQYGGMGTDSNRSPYMEVTDAAISNPLPPTFGSGKTTVGAAASDSKIGKAAPSSSPADGMPWQPGMNLRPPGALPNSDAAPANKGSAPSSPGASHPAKAWIPAPAGDKAWTPPSARTTELPAAPTAPAVPAPSSSNGPSQPVAAAPKLKFPGETVPSSPAPNAPAAAPVPQSTAPSLPAPILPVPVLPVPAQATMPMAQPGGFNQFPRPFPPVPMPGMASQGGMPPNAMPQQPFPQQPFQQQPMPQQPFAGQFIPGGPIRPGFNPQFPQFPAGAPGMPNYFPQAPAAPSAFPPMPMPPGGMPGYYPQQGGMPGYVGYPPQGMPPQAMPSQPMMPQAFAPQAAAPTASPNFLDDVLNGPSRGGRSPMDELGFGDSGNASSATSDWQPDNSAQSGPVAAEQSGYGQSPSPAMSMDFDASAAGTSQHRRAGSHSSSKQGSRTMLIGGALAAVALLAAALVVAMVLSNKRNEPPVAVSDPPANGPTDGSTGASQNPPSTKTPSTPPNSAHDPSNTKTPVPPTPAGANTGAKIPVGPSPKNPVGTNPTPNPAPMKNPGSDSGPPNPNKNPKPLILQPTTPDATTPKPPKPPVVDPAKAARLNRTLIEVRQKLAERNQDDANRMIAEAKTLAVSPEQQERVQRMSALVKYVGEFWGAVRDAMKALKPTDEIDVGSTKVVVVENDAQSMTIHTGAGNKRITLRDMPSGFAIALANGFLDASKPENKIFVGAFCAVDPKYVENRDEAKRLWNEASAAGVSDGAYLLPLLNPEPVESEMPSGGMDALLPVPDSAVVERATRKIREGFDDAIAAATTPIKQGELIQKLLDAADSSDDPVRQYALCMEARDTAAKAGRAKLAIDAIDRIARQFRVDALDMKADTFSNFPPATESGGREAARSLLALVEEAVNAKRMALASRLAQLAVQAAQVSKGNQLIKQATQRSKEIESLASK